VAEPPDAGRDLTPGTVSTAIESNPAPRLARSVADGSGAMFDRIACRYDLLNRLMSLGQDQSWRRRAGRALRLRAGQRVLDLATGTADQALLVAGAAPGVRVIGLDPSTAMLGIGRRKAAARGLADQVALEPGDAQELPFESRSFDACSMAFGIRNVSDRPRALAEMARVTRPGGRIAILELSEPRGVLAPLARLYVHHLVPALGRLLSGEREYRYLQRSIAAFPSPGEFTELIARAGLTPVATTPLTLGVCHLFVAEAAA
jgi:demethylmenaquinone methyltransferase/2-methoxy-6-polyprenyl-1,4-benzoquinol methylase